MIEVFFYNFGLVFVKAFQQRNVAHLHYWLVAPTSVVFAILEILVIYRVAQSGLSWDLLVPFVTGGSLGCIASMKLHEHLVRKRDGP